jgi:hypothetical protein
MILCLPFYYFKNNLYFKSLILLVYRTQNDMYKISKLFWIILLMKKDIILFVAIQQTTTINNVA